MIVAEPRREKVPREQREPQHLKRETEPCPSGAVKKSLWCAGRGWGRHPCLPVFKYLLAALAGKMPAPLIFSQPLTVAARKL